MDRCAPHSHIFPSNWLSLIRLGFLFEINLNLNKNRSKNKISTPCDSRDYATPQTQRHASFAHLIRQCLFSWRYHFGSATPICIFYILFHASIRKIPISPTRITYSMTASVIFGRKMFCVFFFSLHPIQFFAPIHVQKQIYIVVVWVKINRMSTTERVVLHRF